jgi:CheY-like chemotaxis protein
MRTGGGPHRRVVVADNDPDALDLIVIDLGLEGHTVVGTAVSGEEAIEVCERLRPEVLVVDYRMPPGMTGLEAAKRLVRSVPEMRIVVYTNHVRADLMGASARLGVRMLAKGSLRELRQVVAEA